MNAHPGGPNFHSFSLYDQPFSRYKTCQKSEMHRMTPERPQARNCQKDPVHTEDSPPKPKFHSLSLYAHLFSRYKLMPKIGNASNDPRMTLTTKLSKVPCIHWIHTPEGRGPNFIPSRSTVARFLDKWRFWVPYSMVKFKNSLKIVSSKFQIFKTVLLWEPLRRKFRKSLKWF